MALYTGLGQYADTGFLKSSLGIAVALASPTALFLALFGSFAGGTYLSSAKSGYTNEWTSVGTSVDTAYARTLAGTATSGIGSGSWTVSSWVSGTGQVATNATQVAFAAVTGSPVYLCSVALVDSVTWNAGNIWWMADVNQYQVTLNVQVAFFVGDITLTLN